MLPMVCLMILRQLMISWMRRITKERSPYIIITRGWNQLLLMDGKRMIGFGKDGKAR